MKLRCKHEVKTIHCRKILDSHARFTTEFVLELEDGTIGVGSAPRAETPSIYEKNGQSTLSLKDIGSIIKDETSNKPVSQAEFDACLMRHLGSLGKRNCVGLSFAFFDAIERSNAMAAKCGDAAANGNLPHICLNILNGGRFAYTNPVLSDFTEYLLVSKDIDLESVIYDHAKVQKSIREKLLMCDRSTVNGNSVSRFEKKDNRACLDFLVETLDQLHLANKYDLMIDASAGDLWTGRAYNLSLTDAVNRTNTQMCDYWIDLIDSYDIKFLEDPFHEKDFTSWNKLTHAQRKCTVIGDNFYCSDPQRIREGALKGYTHGTIIKPDQAGTVSSTIEAINVAKRAKQTIITSHRSVSTESNFLSVVTNRYRVEYIKIGPLLTDYSSIIRLNDLIRLSGISYE